MNVMQVIESPVLKLPSGKHVETYAMLKINSDSVMVTVEYNGFLGTAMAFKEIRNYNDALDAVKTGNLVEIASNKVMSQLTALRIINS